MVSVLPAEGNHVRDPAGRGAGGRGEDGRRRGEGRWRTQEKEATCLLSLIVSEPPQQDVDPLNQTLSFQEGEELKLREWSEGRRGWSQRAHQTLLDALANMDVKSISRTVVEAEQGLLRSALSG